MPIKIEVIGADALEKAAKIAVGAKEKLMVSLFNVQKAFGFDAVARAKRDYLRGPKPDKIESKGQLKSRINTDTKRSDPYINTTIGSDVIYARIQELGGVTHPTLTDKMRKFAWAMFFQSGDDKWKRLALSKKKRLKITIPERPYLRPAIQDALPDFQENIARVLNKISFTEAA